MPTTRTSTRGYRYAALLALPLALAALVANSGPSAAATAQSATRPQFERVQFADVIEATQPAVVQITVLKTGDDMTPQDAGRPDMGGGAFEEFMRRFGQRPFNDERRGGPGAQAQGLGSGFIIDPSGYIVTNNHVVSQSSDISVTLQSGETLPAKLVGSDSQTDLALIKVEGLDLPSIKFGDSDATRVGEWVVAIGSPFGFGGSVTAGIISARGRDIRSGPYDDYFQIDAPINSGNSGGPIIDASGQVVGVNTAIYSPSGGNIGIGFAIPAVDAERVVSELREKGAVTRGLLGVQIQGLNAEVAKALGLEDSKGALVAEVVENSAAAKAGIRSGDVITHYDGTAINTPRDLSKAVARTAPGMQAAVKIIRAGQAQTLKATVDRHTEPVVANAGATGSATVDTLGLGLALGSLSPATREQMELDTNVAGALVLGIKAGGVAESGGIRPGDIILRVDQIDVADAEAAEQALAEAKREQRPTIVLIRRGNGQFFTTMNLA